MNDDTMLHEFHRDGYVVLPELFSAVACAGLKHEARKLLDQPSPPAGVWRTPSVYVGASLASQRFERLSEDPRLLSVLWRLIPEGPMFLSDKIVFKSAEQRFASPWHADTAYWRGTRPKLSAWIALDDVDARNGALKVVPGSHRGTWEHRHGPGVSAKDEFVHTATPTWPKESEVVVALKRGGVIVFSDRLLHASTENTAGSDRYSLINTYQATGPDEAFDLQCPARRALPRLVGVG